VKAAFLLMAAVLAGVAEAQPVPEGIHGTAGETPSLCGRSAATVGALLQQVSRDLPELPGTGRFVAFEDPAELRVWTFTTPAHPAHPTVACRSLTKGPDGSVYANLEIDCRATREKCDSLYREFEALDRKVRRELQGSR
jgi:hypothetical protein